MKKTQSNSNNSSKRLKTISLLIGIWKNLKRKRKIQVFCLFLVMILSGFAEVFSLAAVVPLLAVLSNPESVWKLDYVQSFSQLIGFTNPNQLLIPITIAFSFAALLAAFVRLLNIWLNNKLSAVIGTDLSCESYRRTLYQPYSIHVRRNTSKVITATTKQVDLTVFVIYFILQLFTSLVVILCLITALIAIDWLVALISITIFSFAYLLISLLTKRRLSVNSKLISEGMSSQLKVLQEGLGAIRDVILDGSQKTYLRHYQSIDSPMRRRQAHNNYLAAFPRFAIESLGLVMIAMMCLILTLHSGKSSNVLPVLGSLALGAQRLLPAMQQVYRSWAYIRGNESAVSSVLEMLNQPVRNLPSNIKLVPFNFKESCQFKNISFAYDRSSSLIVENLNLEFKKGEKIGIMGTTGSGKSTTLDLLMGLLKPTSGEILVDGININLETNIDELTSWRSSIAHVPQTIYLSDCSFAENIAFCETKDNIDMSKVKFAAAQAQIADFIESSEYGYATLVGERGVRLSGGQRQRIGIARALYKKFKLLILDEATSALDNQTESAVMNSIEKFSKEATLIIIAHRLTTLKHCDRIIRLSQGVVECNAPPEIALKLNT